jgi:hypothetical protein
VREGKMQKMFNYKLKNRLISLLLVFMMSTGVVLFADIPEAEAAMASTVNAKAYVTSSNGAFMRKSASVKSKKVTGLKKGTQHTRPTMLTGNIAISE